jgi:RNA polymerase sigma-70 factor (ECF subfamily)
MQVHHALNGMDAIDREILALRHFEQLTLAEAGQVLGIQRTAANNRYVRALKRLKALLAESPYFNETQSERVPVRGQAEFGFIRLERTLSGGWRRF